MGAAGDLDHLVVNVLHEMDKAAACFSALGFQLTPLGRHSLGSINHLMMTSGPYLELVGVPESKPWRQDVLDSPFGLNGLVLRSPDADATFVQLHNAGIEASPPLSFSRPVEIEGQSLEARFRTVVVKPETFPAGRVYYCEHLTPELVWRPAWFEHPNGFIDIDGLVIASPDPVAEAKRYAAACQAFASFSAEGWRIRLGAFDLDIIEGPAPRFIRFDLCFTSLDEIERRAEALPAVQWLRHDAHAATLRIPALDLHIACRSGA